MLRVWKTFMCHKIWFNLIPSLFLTWLLLHGLEVRCHCEESVERWPSLARSSFPLLLCLLDPGLGRGVAENVVDPEAPHADLLLLTGLLHVGLAVTRIQINQVQLPMRIRTLYTCNFHCSRRQCPRPLTLWCRPPPWGSRCSWSSFHLQCRSRYLLQNSFLLVVSFSRRFLLVMAAVFPVSACLGLTLCSHSTRPLRSPLTSQSSEPGTTRPRPLICQQRPTLHSGWLSGL